MKKIIAILFIIHCSLFVSVAQTLNVRVGSVTYLFPAAQTGEMTYDDGKTLSIMGKTFMLADIDAMAIDDTSVKDNTVNVDYDGGIASVTIAGNVAQYVDVTVNGAHVNISQTNTADVDGDEDMTILDVTLIQRYLVGIDVPYAIGETVS